VKRKRPYGLQHIRRMVKAKVGQVLDRGLFTVTGDIAIKVSHLLGTRVVTCLTTADDFDAKYGTDTSGIVQPWNLDIPEHAVSQAIQYATAHVTTVDELLASLDIKHEEYSFIDLGSGKGRALLLASRFPFRQIIGVELSAQLRETSHVNIARFKANWQQCTNIRALCENATEFSFPAGNIVLYLFNPFGAETLRAVVSNLEAAIHETPARIYVIYVKPVHRRVFEESKRFKIFRAIGHNLIYSSDIPS